MRKSMIAAGCLVAATSTAATWAQAAPAAGGSCYIEVQKLMAPQGIEELGAAVRQLDETLRPQVEEINFLRREIARLEAPGAPGVQLASDTVTDDFVEPRTLLSANTNDPLAGRLQRMMAELDARQAQLKLAYGEQMRAIMGPVQAKVGARANAFGAQRGCAAMKMARSADLGSLRTQGAHDLTSEFVSWYASNKG